MGRPNGKDRGIFEKVKGTGIFWARYYDADGREHRELVGPKGLAKKVYEKRKTEIRMGMFFPPKSKRKPVFVADILTEYETYETESGKRAECGSKAHERIRDMFGAMKVDEVSRTSIEEWLRELNEDLSESRVNKHLTILRAAYNLALRREPPKASRNPTFGIKALKENNKRTRILSPVEERALFKVLPKDGILLPLTALDAGLRRSECLRLRVKDIDFTSDMIHVVIAKSGEGRSIPMPKTLRAVMLVRCNALIKAGEKAGLSPTAVVEQYLFQAPGGGYLYNFDTRVWRPAITKARLVDFHFHDLRHTYASRLVQGGVDLRRVQILLGHKSLKTTERYAHLAPEHLRQAVKVLDRGRRGAGLGAG